MTMYRLLRNNKDTGPYTFEQMVELGFKPYDLIWVEKKSAAWRYPGEIPEFKDLAPLIEEQPYDRFYKKKPSSSDTEKKETTATPEIKEVKKAEPIITAKKEPIKKNNKKVAVILPFDDVNKTNISKVVAIHVPENIQQPAPVIEADIKPVSNEKEIDDYEQKLTNDLEILETKLDEIKYGGIVTPSNNDKKITATEPKIKYTQSLDSIKELYQETLLQRKSQYSRREKSRKLLKKSPVLLYIVALGTLIGFTLFGGNNKTNNTIPPSINLSNQQTGNTETAKINPETGTDIPIISNSENSDPKEEPIVPVTTTNEKPGGTLINSTSQNQETNVTTGDGKPTPGIEMNEEKAAIKINAPAAVSPVPDIYSQVTISANNYKRGAFGGIKDLELTVKNNSRFIVDEVIVELMYLKPSEETLKFEKITFSNISPNGTLTLQIPDNSRGIKVNYKITAIHSTGYKNYTAGL